MANFALDVAAVVVGIAAYKKLCMTYDEILWKWRQRHSSSSYDDPFDAW